MNSVEYEDFKKFGYARQEKAINFAKKKIYP